ncbi:MAG: pantoate--beta-alanine ligase [Candidatus Schekmanbacteria bacterium RBG_16_38_11]|uniref:Pantothenate synthetase n=1 Tax=Candidatus Schekmanbacteria bacterium RBG_16_38_11 TaxID=1817880 RepID=A0A1F7RTP8_9BACT|nr:MAG: pantoate--beta-alanine ligase [Candidatus Schekmanbacteria bacterium RBG_16_38_11]
MKIVKLKKEMKKIAEGLRKSRCSIGFVPTMGFLHQGHMSLVEQAKKDCDKVVVSIFVNPIQFGKGEDFKSYPRDISSDFLKCKNGGADIIFLPSTEDIYPKGFQTYVDVSRLSKYLCGISRPGHFAGVATVVLKLFNIVKPHRAYFGEKDYQQILIIKQMVTDLDVDVKIINMPIVREADGLAMSSRNRYLTKVQRERARILNDALGMGERLIKEGERNPKKVVKELRGMILSQKIGEIDYISICAPDTLEELVEIRGKVLIALAVKIGRARLIDNRLIGI